MNQLYRAIIVLLFLQPNITFSQHVVLEVNNVRTLYYGYNNRLEFGTTDGRPFELIAENATLELDSTLKEKKQGAWYVLNPFQYQNVRVIMVDPKSKIAFDTIRFKVEMIPDPEIYWGTLSAGNEVRYITESRLFARTSLLCPLNVSWRITSWECIISGISDAPMHGTGNDISAALGNIRLAKMDQKAGKRTNTQIAFICFVVGPDGFSRKIAAVFSL